MRTRTSMNECMLKRRSVRKIEHSSMNRAEFSCGPIRLRVQSDLKFGCSIRWSNKRRSITELNSDSHSKTFIVSTKGRHTNETQRSWVVVPSSNQAALPQRFPSSSNAGHAPAFVESGKCCWSEAWFDEGATTQDRCVSFVCRPFVLTMKFLL